MVGGDVHAVEAEAEVANDWVVEVLDGGGVNARCGLPSACGTGRSGWSSPTRSESLVVRVRPAAARRISAVSRAALPSRGRSVCARGSRKMKRASSTGRVGAATARRTARVPSGVGGEDVETIVAHIGGGAGDRRRASTEYPAGSAAWRRRRRGRAAGRLRRAGEVKEVRALGVVELQRPGQRLQHALGDAAQVAAFESRVVRGADAGQEGDLFAAQPRNPAGHRRSAGPPARA